MTVLYITQNGITDHIGRSQVAPYVLSLARQGFKIHVLSAEKLGQDALIKRYQELFDAAGVKWTRVRYHRKPPLIGQAWTQAVMHRTALNIVRSEGIKMIHCRSFPPALIGHQLKRKLGVKFIFDFRDFYADGGLEKTHGMTHLAFRYFKKLEGSMIREADKVVCLTESAKKVLTEWYLSDMTFAKQHFKIIPCCADFMHFNVNRLSSEAIEYAQKKADLQPGDFVLLYLGSLGRDYLLPQMVALFRQVLTVKPGALFLFVSNNGKEMVLTEFDKQGVCREYVRYLSADRDEIPALVATADLSVFFYREGLRSIGCSPTKLAELFACNVPVIANTGVGDLDNIISLQRNGSVVVNDFSDVTLRAAVEQVIAFKETSSANIRENSIEFALEEGGARYAYVYRELLAAPEEKKELAQC